jgi:hypothetical protein
MLAADRSERRQSMVARVARWEDGDGDAMRRAAEQVASQAASGPPEGVPAKGFLLLVDPDNGRQIGVTLFESEEDLRRGDEVLNSMSPPEVIGRRAPVEMYEVAVDVRS